MHPCTCAGCAGSCFPKRIPPHARCSWGAFAPLKDLQQGSIGANSGCLMLCRRWRLICPWTSSLAPRACCRRTCGALACVTGVTLHVTLSHASDELLQPRSPHLHGAGRSRRRSSGGQRRPRRRSTRTRAPAAPRGCCWAGRRRLPARGRRRGCPRASPTAAASQRSLLQRSARRRCLLSASAPARQRLAASAKGPLHSRLL